MIQKFEMSMMAELKYFLGFQIKQLQDGTFVSQTKYIQDILKKFGMKNGKPIKTPMGTNGHLDRILCFLCARFQANPKEVHLRAVKRIMRYLVYTPKFGLWYPGDQHLI
jgi:hypothetical protein